MNAVLVGLCIGIACRFLQPKQPDSVFATLLLILAVFIGARL